MKKLTLFPNRSRPLGWAILLPALALGVACMYLDFSWSLLDLKSSWLFNFYEGDILAGELNFTDELAALGVIIGLLILVFSAEKLEDEWSAAIRLRALSWAVWLHYFVLLLAIVFVHGSAFFTVLVYNMFTLLFLFGLRFRYLLWKASKQVEEV